MNDLLGTGPEGKEMEHCFMVKIVTDEATSDELAFGMRRALDVIELPDGDEIFIDAVVEAVPNV